MATYTTAAAVWASWCSSGTATTITDPWGYWNDSSTTTATATITDVWYSWNGSWVPAVATQPSQEERAAAVAKERERAAEYIRLAAEAEARAKELLEVSLTEDQKEEFSKAQSFTVISKDGQRKYRVRKGRSDNVECIDGAGKRVATLCAHPVENVPDFDTMLAQKLMLEHDEPGFLKMANRRAIA